MSHGGPEFTAPRSSGVHVVGTNGPQKCGSVSRPNIDLILSSSDDYPYCLRGKL